MALQVSGGGFSFQFDTTDGRWTWGIRASNIRAAGQFYEVTDVGTPWGPLTSARIPIPGEVVQAMAESLTSFQAQLAPVMTLPSPATTSFSVTVNEGGTPVAFGPVSVANSGAFGSFMTASATPSSSWLQVSPASVAGLGQGQQAAFSFTVLPSLLLATSSPYAGTVNLQDNRSPPTIVPVSVSVTVLPRPTISLSETSVTLTYSLTTMSAGGAASVSIANSGPPNSTLDWLAAKIQNCSPWLAVTPVSGGPLAAGSSESLTFSVVSSAVPMIAGTYSDTVRYSASGASNSPVDLVVNLVVSA